MDSDRIPLRRHEAWRIPHFPGVYVIEDQGRVVYIGKATNLRTRFLQHARRSHNRALARAALIRPLTFSYRLLFTSTDLDHGERALIRGLDPAFNLVRYQGEAGGQ